MRWIIAVLIGVFATIAAAKAQDVAEPAKIADLMRLLQDPEVRSWLETRPVGVAKPPTQSSSGLAAWEASIRNRISSVIGVIPSIPNELLKAASRTRENAISHGGAPVFLIFFALTLFGIVAERAFAMLRRTPRNLVDRLLGVAVFSVAMAFVFFAREWPPLARIVLLVALAGLVSYRILSVLLDSSQMAAAVRHRVRAFMAVAIVAVATATLGEPLSVNPMVVTGVSFCFSIILLMIAVEGFVRKSRRSLRVRIAYALACLVAWGLWAVGLPGVFWLTVYAMMLPPTLRLVERVVANALSRDEDNLKRVVAIRASRATVIAVAIVWISIVWRLNPDSLTQRDPIVAALTHGILKSVIVVLLADLVWHLAKSWIDRKLATSSDTSLRPEELARQARMRTLLPIFRNLLGVMVAVIATLVVLAELGVEIGPLIAGAGVFGVAVGFGSQTLVKDVISGVFYMLDDAFRVGEYIQAKSYKGVVEGFSLRSVKLRHHRGPLFTVPFGELGAVENLSRDWSVVKFRVSVSFDTDVEQARKLTKRIGAALAEDEEFGPLFIEPLRMKGVEEFGDYGMVLSFGMTLRPSSHQSMIRRRANLMLREAFKENGIAFAQPTVQVGGDEKTAAASAALRIQNAKAMAMPTP
ncbi:mechanosensitive ion channel family protein [Rhizobium sp. LC145]|uniref:mechanosensitive ion channel family protein n=1 Tax=Rhizobium sp. LC145 TaxID=1120688 RepID=UPI000629EA9E|nr:mechanosensitive ion channel family protein [Rhizobium sp. LC145]KKX23862.1 mechanosensitive ion channel protein [Rhizobium sp. LC145]TKT67092.1 mechanosensitive ion channel family protein [Rhizobiaceae bacterium LC148]